PRHPVPRLRHWRSSSPSCIEPWRNSARLPCDTTSLPLCSLAARLVLYGKSHQDCIVLLRLLFLLSPLMLQLCRHWQCYENEIQVLHSCRVSFIRRSGLCGSGPADCFQHGGAEFVVSDSG